MVPLIPRGLLLREPEAWLTAWLALLLLLEKFEAASPRHRFHSLEFPLHRNRLPQMW